MSVRVRLNILIGAVSVLIIGGLVAFRSITRIEVETYVRERAREQERQFDRITALRGQAADKFVNYEYSLWDEMVRFIVQPDSYWARQNVDFGRQIYDLDGIWILGPSFATVYETGGRPLPIARDQLARLFADTVFVHFFVITPDGPLEVRGATVHPSNDNQRLTPSRGYFLAARLWSPRYLTELSELTESELALLQPTGPVPEVRADRSPGVISFIRALAGPDGTPVTRLQVRSESPALRQISSSTGPEIMILGAGAVVVLLLLTVFLTSWVSRPLARLTRSLTAEGPDALGRLVRTRDEFGHVARLLARFFDQRKRLVDEVAERRRVEAELNRYREHLEELVATRARALEQAQSEIVKQEKLAILGRIAGGVAHELRNPLSVIRGSVYYLKLALDPAAQGKVARHLKIIDQEVERASRVISAVLDSTRGVSSERAPRALRPLLELAVAGAELPPDIQVVFDIPADLVPVEVDESQITIVFRNLLANAAQAMPAGGVVRLRARAEDGMVTVSVVDAGAGIGSEDLPRIFEPLFTTRARGMGLGLTVARAFVEANGGTITAASEPGRTTFTVRLPAATPDEP